MIIKPDGIRPIAEESKMLSLISAIEAMPEPANKTDPDPENRIFANLAHRAKALQKSMAFYTEIWGDDEFGGLAFTKNLAADRAEFKDFLFMDLIRSDDAQIFFNDQGNPEIYASVHGKWVRDLPDPAQKEKNVQIITAEHGKIVQDFLAAREITLVSQKWLNKKPGIAPFSIYADKDKRKHFEFLWKHQVEPTLFPGPVRRAGNWMKEKLHLSGVGHQRSVEPPLAPR